MTRRRLRLTSRVLKPTRPLKDRRFRQSPMTVRALKHPMSKAVPPNQALARRLELAEAKPTAEPGDRRDLDESHDNDYEINEINKKSLSFLLFRFFRFFRNLSSSPALQSHCKAISGKFRLPKTGKSDSICPLAFESVSLGRCFTSCWRSFLMRYAENFSRVKYPQIVHPAVI